MFNLKHIVQICDFVIRVNYLDELKDKYNYIHFRRIAKINGKYITNITNESVANDLRIFRETQVKRILRNVLVSKIIKKKLSYFSQDENIANKIFELNNPQDLQKGEQYAIHNLGHATQLIQIYGFNILTDPVFNSLNAIFYPEKTISQPNFKYLPKVDIIIISHNHRDHVDKKSITDLIEHYESKNWSQPFVLVPLGDKNLLEVFGFKSVFEVDWFVKISFTKCIDGLNKFLHLISVPADHRSGRESNNIHKSLVLGWVINPDIEGVIFKYSGDTRSLSHENQLAVDAVLWNEITYKKMNEGKSNKDVEIPSILLLEPSGPNYTRCDMDITHQSTSYSALLKLTQAQNLFKISNKKYEEFLDKMYTVMVHHNKYELGPDRFNEGLFVFKKLILYLDFSTDDLNKELARQEDKLRFNKDRVEITNNIPAVYLPIVLSLPSQTSLLIRAKDFIIQDILKTEMKLSNPRINRTQMKDYLLNRTIFPKIGERLNCHKVLHSKFKMDNVQKYCKSTIA